MDRCTKLCMHSRQSFGKKQAYLWTRGTLATFYYTLLKHSIDQEKLRKTCFCIWENMMTSLFTIISIDFTKRIQKTSMIRVLSLEDVCEVKKDVDASSDFLNL